MNRRLSSRCILFILMFGISFAIFGQTYKLDIGTERMQLSVSSVFADRQDILLFPRELDVYQISSRELTSSVAKGAGIIIAAKDFPAKAYYRDNIADPNKWTVADNFFPYFMVDATAWFTVDPTHSTVPVGGGAHRYWKQRPPERIIQNQDFTSRNWVDGRDFDGPADMPTTQYGTTTCNTLMGITVTQRAWVFDNADFAISEYVFKYTGHTGSFDNNGEEIIYNDPVKDCYVGIKFRPILSHQDVVVNSSGWKEGTDDWVDYVDTEDGEQLRVLYGWDGDAGSDYQLEDDEGDPLYFSSGFFAASGYPGMAVLYADKAPDNPVNDPSQPHHFHVSFGATFSSNTLTLGRNLTMENIYNILDSDQNSPSPFDWQGWKNAGNPADDAQYWHYGTPHATNESRNNQVGTLAFGPYQFNNINDSVRVVVCYAVGMLGWEQNIDLGASWKTKTIDKSEKNRILRSGRDSLFTQIKNIKQMFDPKFTANNGNLKQTLYDMASEIGIPPAWPSRLQLNPVIGGCRVEWAPVDDAVAYRVYRRSQIDFDIASPSKEPAYKLVYQCGGSNPGNDIVYSPSVDSTVWVDQDVYTVFNYWYTVTAVNEDGAESSKFIMRINPLPSNDTYGSIIPFDKEYVNLNDVHVIPNPYNVRSMRLYDFWTSVGVKFTGLPANCRIRIYAQNGTLIFEDNHRSQEDLPVSIYQWNLRTSMNQTVASGLYVYVIDQCRDFLDRDIDATKVGKLVVIR
ncbi:hypothetical protein JXQ31_09485 [candidate division KSB1 bacterium]|nr:hypothetical protein [candidate division KSB1 bacterium]